MTEPGYVKALSRSVGRSATIVPRIVLAKPHAIPMPLVREAEADQLRGEEADEWWCIFDVESPTPHPHLQAACERAKKLGFEVAVSNPCFETWLIAHYIDPGGELSSDAAKRRLRKVAPRYESDLASMMLFQSEPNAVARCQQLDARHAGNGTKFPHNNPSSTMPKFIKAVRGS